MPPVFREDPYTGYNFEVVVAGVSEDGTAVRGSFSEAMIGDTSMDPIEYRNGSESLTVRKIPGLIKFANITLKRGYTGDLAFWNLVVEAMNGLVRRTQGSVIIIDENRNEVMRWNFRRVSPCKSTSTNITANNNEMPMG